MLSSQPYQEQLECPRCHQHSIVQRNRDIYQCLNCQFQRDFSESAGDGFVGTLVAALALVLLLALV
ncbi:MAG: hypothetical protein F6J97_02510 [Leptolyngbya sp. SIO4C1]|nr:hypothetical protein [Leptolyngbya sp. SIO4C1]